MTDDLNVPEALAAVLEGAKLIRASNLSGASGRAGVSFMTFVNDLLGLPRTEREGLETERESGHGAFEEQIDRLIRERTEARASRDFERADAIRNELGDMGVEIMDSPEGTTWKLKTPSR
jgi:cysteinyl-tRNA synthetase